MLFSFLNTILFLNTSWSCYSFKYLHLREGQKERQKRELAQECAGATFLFKEKAEVY